MAGLFDRLESELEARQRLEEGITPSDLLDLPPELGRVINMIMRRGEMSLTDVIMELDARPSEAKGLLDRLVEKGYLRTFQIKGELHYKTFFSSRRRGRGTPLSVWDALTDKME